MDVRAGKGQAIVSLPEGYSIWHDGDCWFDLPYILRNETSDEYVGAYYTRWGARRGAHKHARRNSPRLVEKA
jgi:hypothetical protein